MSKCHCQSENIKNSLKMIQNSLMCINRTKDMPKRSHEYGVANKQAGK